MHQFKVKSPFEANGGVHVYRRVIHNAVLPRLHLQQNTYRARGNSDVFKPPVSCQELNYGGSTWYIKYQNLVGKLQNNSLVVFLLL